MGRRHAAAECVETAESGIAATGYPALLDDDDSVSLRVLTNADLQRRVMHGGVRRLLLLTAAPSARDVLRGLVPARPAGDRPQRVRPRRARRRLLVRRRRPRAAPARAAVGRRRVRRAAARRAPGGAGRRRRGAGRGPPTCSPRPPRSRERLARLDRAGAAALGRRRRGATSPGSCGRGSSSSPARPRLDDVARYVAGHRVPPRPPRRATSAATAGGWTRSSRSRTTTPPLLPARASTGHAAVELGWRLEELRVSVFAQPVGAKGGVSATKVRRELRCPRLDPSECFVHRSARAGGPGTHDRTRERPVRWTS